MSLSLEHAQAAIGDRYTLLEPLGDGGSSTVFRAKDGANETVALKVLNDTTPELVQRFQRESSVLAALSHPSIVRVHADHTHAARPHLALEFVDAPTLRSNLEAQGAADLNSVHQWLPALLDALKTTHERGIVHGDLKPENIMLSSPAKLVDFGTSKIEGFERLTRTGQLSGTPIYLAPEVFMGRAAISVQLDVYGLGLTLHETLSGQRPFDGNAHPGAVMMAIAAGERRPLPENVPTAWRDFIASATHPKKDQRFESMQHMEKAFKSL